MIAHELPEAEPQAQFDVKAKLPSCAHVLCHGGTYERMGSNKLSRQARTGSAISPAIYPQPDGNSIYPDKV